MIGFDAEVLALSDDKSDLFCTTKAISTSHDNNAVLCCAEKLRIITVVVSPHIRNRRQKFTTVVEETTNVSDLDKFSISTGLISLKDTVKHLNEEERQMLMTDPSLTADFIFPNEMLSCFKQAVCSPMNLLERSQNLIAAVTHGHRILIFSRKADGWKVVADCSKVLREHAISGEQLQLPLTLGKDMSLHQYKDLVFRMCTVELEWSTMFPLDTQGKAYGQLLFTGTRRGDIHVWMVHLPFENKENLEFQCSDFYPSEVTAMSWLSYKENRGMLAVGYLDGSLRVVECAVSNSGSTPTVTLREAYKMSEPDALTISDLARVAFDQSLTALVACKQYYLSLYVLSQDTVQLISHKHVDVDLPFTCISTFGAHGVVSTADGSIFSFQCQRESDQVRLDISNVSIASLPGNAKMAWLCHGVALSPTSGLCFSAHRYRKNYMLPEIRMKTLCRQQVIVSNPCRTSIEALMQTIYQKEQPVSPQHLMINVRYHIQQLIQNSASCQDILQLSQDICARQDIFSFQVTKDILQTLEQWCAIKLDFQQGLEQVKQMFEEVSHKLLISHIELALSHIPAMPTARDQQVLKSMLGWICATKAQSSFSHQPDLESLKKKCDNIASVPCAICGSDLHVTESLQACCTKGHRIRLCILTFLPCQDKSARKCESCQHLALSLAQLSDVNIIKIKSLCTICGGFLREWFI